VSDQAATLRVIRGGDSSGATPSPRRERAIAVTGGKGGVGKSTVALNLAMAYAQRGARTLMVDTDLGMADLNLLLGVAPGKSMLDVLDGAPIEEALVSAHGIHLLPALNGSYLLETMGPAGRRRVFAAIDSLSHQFDTLVIDVAAGIGANQVAFAGAVTETIIVINPEPLSMADAYACLKALSREQGLRHAYVVPNRVASRVQADELVQRLSLLVSRFLDVELLALPAIPADSSVSEAAEHGVPLMVYRPDAPAARAIRAISRTLDTLALPDERDGVARLFWKKTLGGCQESAR
jgi:flagellar biosynthesis protein FlhG